MPHIIMEYAECCLNVQQVEIALNQIHQLVDASDLFQTSHIKTRAYPFKHFTNGGESQPYIHVQVRIKSGRKNHQKKQLADNLLNALVSLNSDSTVITVEVIDMDKDSYARYTTE